MKKNEIIRKIANDAEISQIEAGKVFDAIFALFAEELENGNEVAVPGFGTFKLVASKERKGSKEEPEDHTGQGDPSQHIHRGA